MSWSSHSPFCLRPSSRFVLRSLALRAFTLVELLAVIAIIGVLAAILFPVYGSVKRATNTSTCLSNLRQIGTATLLYCSEHKGNFPRAASFPPDTLVGSVPWNRLIYPYVGLSSESDSSPIFKCPADPHDDEIALGGVQHRTRSYSFNGAKDLSTSGIGLSQSIAVNGTHVFPVRKLSDVTAPSKTIMVSEWWTNKTGALVDNWQDTPSLGLIVGGWGNLNQVPISSEGSGFYHGDKYNVVFVDGHVQSVTPQAIIDGESGDHISMWTAVR